MPFDYYCTYCGRKITHDTVLYDMSTLLTEADNDESSFKILKFRLTKAELEQLFESGVPTSQGFRRCSITLSWLANVMSNSNNLGDANIKGLTAADVVQYCQAQEKKVVVGDISGDDYDDEFMDEEPEVKEELPKEAPAEIEVSEAIAAIEGKDTRNSSNDLTKNDLVKDFEVLNGKFFIRDGGDAKEQPFSFELSLLTERDSENKDVLFGYVFRVGDSATAIRRARVCPHCVDKTSRVFDQAGTARHRTVTFIGDQKAGKTCTILALSHYAERGLCSRAMSTDPIWANFDFVPSIANVTPLCHSERLKKDLGLFGRGIAPEKTVADKREDAYSATFKIQNRDSDDCYILTLTDLPGELCNDDGSLKDKKIRNEFQIALACDVFVLCFDTSVQHDLATINRACSWANYFQLLRAEYKRNTENEVVRQKAFGNFAPIMVLFTKSKEIENGLDSTTKVAPKNILDRIAQTYTFSDERRYIEANEICRVVGERMSEYDNLKSVYHARLRCSPYGFDAPKESQVNDSTPTRYPEPKNIAQLMRWILSVSGCAATDAAYRQSPDEADREIFEIPANFVKRPQYRHECPAGNGQDGDVAEALARCYLFENPGNFDRKLLQNYDQKFVKTRLRIEMKLRNNVL